jgi:hypothetical protein
MHKFLLGYTHQNTTFQIAYFYINLYSDTLFLPQSNIQKHTGGGTRRQFYLARIGIPEELLHLYTRKSTTRRHQSRTYHGFGGLGTHPTRGGCGGTGCGGAVMTGIAYQRRRAASG